jgi:2-polyprenyl-3-methyl-5-hydroxy-6-metoxy-1,4-benzoquinol methylase
MKKIIDKNNLHMGGNIKGGDPNTWFPLLWDFLFKKYNINSIVDIGCGEGYSAKYFREKITDVVAIDGLSKNLKKIPENIKKIQVDYEKTYYILDKEYDMAWMCEFVEHINEIKKEKI